MSQWLELDRLRAEPSLRRVEWAAEMTSTSDRALELAQREELATPLLVVTDSQTAGRGRGVNRWVSSLGALTFTLIVDLPAAVGPQRRSQASLRTGLAVRSALADFAPERSWTLKWPNDLFLDERKVCGMLIESSATQPDRLVIGIGVNVNNSLAAAPPPLCDTATSIVDSTRRAHELTDVLVTLVRGVTGELARHPDHVEPLVDRWRPHCFLTGRSVQLEAYGRRITGLCRGIDDQGALVLATDQGEQAFLSGSVVSYER